MKITVIEGNEKKEIAFGEIASEGARGRRRLLGLLDSKKDERPTIKRISLMSLLRRNGVYFKTECGGSGACGMCKVRFLEGATPVTVQDMTHISEDELKDGFRLACKSFPAEDAVVRVR